MSDTASNISIQSGSEKSFGIVFSSVFLLVALYPLINSEGFRISALVISIIFFLLAFLAPKVLLLPNKLWFRFGIQLGSIIAPIVMLLVYVITLLPIGLVMRLLRKDLLKKNLDKSVKSYWIERKESIGSMNNQF